ncbi:MAG TPA: hypothetical protein VFR65_04260 [Nitrososphaeraceae archaeon]|nr:hypothetical protein [Nitrososphaeraceae archaeon]
MIFLYLSQTRSESILLFPFPNLSIGIMANSIDDIFAIKDEGGKNTDKESTTDSPPNNNKKEGCSPLDPRC